MTKLNRAVTMCDVLTDDETWHPTHLRAIGPAAPAREFVEDDELSPAAPTVGSHPSFAEDDAVVSPQDHSEHAAPEHTETSPETSPDDHPIRTAEDRLALMEQLEREALAKRFQELDRRSEQQAAEQQRLFAERLDAAIAAELGQLRERRQSALAELDEWAAAERKRVTGDLAAEEQRFAERLMRQLNHFEVQLSERIIEQEHKLAGWWSEAERLADQRMKRALEDVDAT